MSEAHRHRYRDRFAREPQNRTEDGGARGEFPENKLAVAGEIRTFHAAGRDYRTLFDQSEIPVALVSGAEPRKFVAASRGFLDMLDARRASVTGRSLDEGADTAVWLATSRDVDGVSGRFFYDRRERPCEFRNQGTEERLWRMVTPDDTPGSG